MIKSILVYCGASKGNHPAYAETAAGLGRLMAERNIRLVYGGGSIGLMGVTANSVLRHGGEVTGVIPTFLNTKEVGHAGVADLRETASMHQRKAIMEQEADAVIALAGGFGTLDELFEILTWAQLGLHAKPIVLINTRKYYQHLLLQLDTMVEEGFLSSRNRRFVQVADTAEAALELVSQPPPQAEEIWLHPGQN
ncbi:MAG: TIGR00730 family Rossman fold protein [Bacteroidetes bacterium]|nr:TIGR00730 family Rossman fold protein [Bacteroidota bacterium]